MTGSKASTEIETKWPGWPDGEEGKFLLDVVLDLPVNEAFLLIYGGLTDLKVIKLARRRPLPKPARVLATVSGRRRKITPPLAPFVLHFRNR